MSIGVAAVVILTALGDGARRYVVGQFSSLGTNLVIVLPGRSGTGGFNPANAITSTPRDLTIDDAASLRRLPGGAPRRAARRRHLEISYGGKLREVMVAGSTAEFIPIRNFEMAQGQSCRKRTGTAARRSPSSAPRSARKSLAPTRRRQARPRRRPPAARRRRAEIDRPGPGHEYRRTGHRAGIAGASHVQFEHPVPHHDRSQQPRHHPGTKDQVLETLKQRHRGEEDVTVITRMPSSPPSTSCSAP
jgi:putative ABC transport system permease protein